MAATPAAPLAAGTPAPDFTAHSTPDQAVSLSEFRGQPVILAFYPADSSPVCGDQLLEEWRGATSRRRSVRAGDLTP